MGEFPSPCVLFIDRAEGGFPLHASFTHGSHDVLLTLVVLKELQTESHTESNTGMGFYLLTSNYCSVPVYDWLPFTNSLSTTK